jgi:hypothetical protein
MPLQKAVHVQYFVFAYAHTLQSDDRSLEDICGQVIEFDNCIRFAGFATKTGKLIAYKYRKASILLLTLGETQLSVLDRNKKHNHAS